MFRQSAPARRLHSACSIMVQRLCVVGFTMDKVEIRLSNLMAFHARAIGNWGCPPELYPQALELGAERPRQGRAVRREASAQRHQSGVRGGPRRRAQASCRSRSCQREEHTMTAEAARSIAAGNRKPRITISSRALESRDRVKGVHYEKRPVKGRDGKPVAGLSTTRGSRSTIRDSSIPTPPTWSRR